MNLDGLFAALRSSYDVDGWWPSDSPFEVMVGAILTQQTAWEQVERVLGSLRAAGLLDVEAMAGSDPRRLEELVRPAGFFRQKARRIRGLAEHIRASHGSDPMSLLSQEMDAARAELLGIDGIGNETADAILLFAGHRPKFVCAVYVSRVLSRTGVFDSSDYDQVQRFVESRLPRDARLYAELYALLVQHARSLCRATPACGRCFLRDRCEFTA